MNRKGFWTQWKCFKTLLILLSDESNVIFFFNIPRAHFLDRLAIQGVIFLPFNLEVRSTKLNVAALLESIKLAGDGDKLFNWFYNTSIHIMYVIT